jgi:hypothetical protein
VEGWQPVEDVVRWGFGQVPVVMANEAHSGLARSVRTRVIGARMIRAAHEAGVRRLAMEALHWPGRDVPGPTTALQDDHGGYLSQPEMRAMISTALDLGWTLWAYEHQFDAASNRDPAYLRSMEHTNWREREQATNLCRLLDAAPGEPMLVWCGNGHASKHGPSGCDEDEWIPMGWNFREMSGIDPFVIDRLGGTAGILQAQAPPPLDVYTNVDALAVSTDNALTGEEPTEDGA